MSRVFRTLVVPMGLVPTINAAACALGPATLSFAWTAPAGPDAATVTHQVSSGLIALELAEALANPEALAAAIAPVAEISLVDASAALAGVDLSSEDAPVALTRLGLQLISTEVPA